MINSLFKKKDDEVKIRVTRVLQKVGFAELVGEKPSQEAEAAGEESYESSENTQEAEEEYSGEDTEDFGEEGK